MLLLYFSHMQPLPIKKKHQKEREKLVPFTLILVQQLIGRVFLRYLDSWLTQRSF